MNAIFKKIFVTLLITGLWSASATVAQQTGAKIIPRDRTSPSVHEGLSGERSAGFKQNVNPFYGQTPVFFFSPFRGVPAYGSLVAPYSVPAPIPSDPSTVGFKYTFSQLVFPLFSQTSRTNRLFPGAKGIGGKNVTDVAEPGVVGGTGPGDLYWVGFPRLPNPQQLPPPVFQQPANPLDCFCRWGETVPCPMAGPFQHFSYGGQTFPLNLSYWPCQVCFGPANIGYNAIVKHDFYVGTDHGAHKGYPTSDPTDTGYQQCLRENQGDPSGGTPGNPFYGL